MLKNKKVLFIILLILSIWTILFGGIQLNISSNGSMYLINISLSIFSIFLFIYMLILYKIIKNKKIKFYKSNPGILIEYLSAIIDFFVVICLSVIPSILIILIIESTVTNTFSFSFSRDYFANRDIVYIIITIIAFYFMFLNISSPVRFNNRSIGQFFTGIYLQKEKKLSKSKSFLRLLLGIITFPFWIFTPRNKQLLHNRLFKISVKSESNNE